MHHRSQIYLLRHEILPKYLIGKLHNPLEEYSKPDIALW